MHLSETSRKEGLFSRELLGCVSFWERNGYSVFKSRKHKATNTSKYSPKRVLCKHINMVAIHVNDNKLFTVNYEKTLLGSKFRRICMGSVLSRNFGQNKHNALKLGD